MGWQDAPVVDNATQSAQPAWMSAPEVGTSSQAVGAAKDLGSAIIRPIAKGLDWAPALVEDAAVQGENIVGNLANKALGRPATPNHPLPSAEFNAELNRVTRAPTTSGGQTAEDISSMVVAPPIAGAEEAGARVVPMAAKGAERAAEYVTQKLGMDWSKLSDSFKASLTKIASKAGDLEKLDPQAVARQARLQSMDVPVPATRGQLTRDPVQLRNEGNIAATQAGAPIRQVHVAQNKALLDNLDVLKGKVRGKGATRSEAETPEQVGQSVQDKALRTKLKGAQSQVKALYNVADKSGETAQKVAVKPIEDLIAQTPDKTHYGWVSSWLKDMGKGTLKLKSLPIKTLEDLRQAAVARAMNGGTEGYYAGKLISTIDDVTEGKGGDLYKAARSARKALANEFEEQGSVAKLVENKSRTDRATALEDTWKKTVLGGSIDDLRNVKRSLLLGGTKDTRTAGRTAWRDIRAQTIQYIKDEAGRSVTRFEEGSPNVTASALERPIKAIGQDKLDEIFGPGTTAKLNQIMEAARDVKTEPPSAPSGAKGSDTARNILAFLERTLDHVPIIRHISTVTHGVGALKGAGENARAAQRATLSAVDEAASRAASPTNRSAQTLQTLGRRAIPAAATALTLQNDGQ